MRYAGIIGNDVVNGQKVCVSFWCQGCPHHCPGCHNQHTWDFNGGLEANEDELIQEVIEKLHANGVERNLSILGGEPLCPENSRFVYKLICAAKKKYPDIKVFVWTGYTISELDNAAVYVMSVTDVLIDGRFDISKKSYTLPLRGSTNQRVIDVKQSMAKGEVVLWEQK